MKIHFVRFAMNNNCWIAGDAISMCMVVLANLTELRGLAPVLWHVQRSGAVYRAKMSSFASP